MLLLVANTYSNYSSLMIVLPIWIKKATDKTADIDATMTVIILQNTLKVFCWLWSSKLPRKKTDTKLIFTLKAI